MLINKVPSKARVIALSVVAGVVALSASPASAINIVANYDSSITNLSNASAVEDTINQAITMFDSTYTNNVTVHITFQNMNSGLGESSTYYTSESTSSIISALQSHSSGDAIDTAALAQLAANPYKGSTIDLTTANARALGFSASASTDSTIGVNSSLCFTGHTTPVANKYDMFSVVSHEIDEALGTSSGVGGNTPWIADLYRYNATGTRTFDTNAAYFSVDGKTDLEAYNHDGYGDYGDWASGTTPQVQDAYGTPGVVVNYGYGETDLLDAVGYNVQPAPEPFTMTVLGGGLAVAAIRRRRSAK